MVHVPNIVQRYTHILVLEPVVSPIYRYTGTTNTTDTTGTTDTEDTTCTIANK